MDRNEVRVPDIPPRFRLRRTNERDREAFERAVMPAFAEVYEHAGDRAWWTAYEMERGIVATEGEKIVATTTSYAQELTIPGPRTIAAAGVASVTVLPTHRRQGLFAALMNQQLADLKEDGEAVAVLLASEGGLYRRFGYGAATFSQTLAVKRVDSAFYREWSDTGRLELLDRSQAGGVMCDVYDAYRLRQVGALARPAVLWDRGAGVPPISREHRFVVVHRDADDRPDGYASYTITPGGAALATADRTLTVDELVALHESVRAAIQRYLFDHDLITTIEFRHTAVDDPLMWRLSHVRAARTIATHDWLWVRLLDPCAALAARTYQGTGQLVLNVTDGSRPENNRRILLSVEQGQGNCAPTELAADISLDVADLGSTYLGGVPFATLERAGRVHEHSEGAAGRADNLFAVDRAPLCFHWF